VAVAGAVVADQLERFRNLGPAELYLLRLGPRSRRTMGYTLDRLARLLSNGVNDARSFRWHQAGSAEILAVRALMVDQQYAPATINLAIAAWRGVQKAAFRDGLIDAERHARVTDVPLVRNDRPPAGRALDASEIGRLLKACDRDVDHPVAAARDAALIAVLYGAGLRRAELASCCVEDLDLERGQLEVLGKGSKRRTAYLQAQVVDRLRVWLDVRGDHPGPLFAPLSRAQRLRDRPLSGAGVAHIVRRRNEQAGGAPTTPHDLRRSAITGLLDAGAELTVVSELVGHSDPRTTAKYARRSDARRHAAADRLPMPA
jgi:integrase